MVRKKEKCIIHIGMPKTGTTTLQEVLFRSIDNTNIRYANLGSSNHGGPIYTLFAQKPENHNLHKLNKHTQKEIDDYNFKNRLMLEEGFLDRTSDIEIISGEDIYHMNEDELQRMKKYLSGFFKSIQIVGYVRSPGAYMNSSFQQLVKFHQLSSFKIANIYPFYRQKLEKFDNVFVNENVLLCEYNTHVLKNGDIVEDFAEKFNLDLNYTKRRSSNESISKELISILFVYNKFDNRHDFGKYTTRVHRKLINSLQKFGKTKFLFSDNFISNIRDRQKEDIKWIEKRLGIVFINPKVKTAHSVDNEYDLETYALSQYKQFLEFLNWDTSDKELRIPTEKNIFTVIESLKKNIYQDFIKSEKR